MAKRETGYVERLTAIRHEIAETRAEVARVEVAPVPLVEALERIAGVVDRAADWWSPRIGELAALSAPDPAVVLQQTSSNHWIAAGLIATVARDVLTETLEEALRRYYATIDAATCIPVAERPER